MSGKSFSMLTLYMQAKKPPKQQQPPTPPPQKKPKKQKKTWRLYKPYADTMHIMQQKVGLMQAG